MKSKLEYIWLDGYSPTQNMRSKTKVIDNFSGNLEDCPIWAFDGSSTKQAEGNSSDCLLKPVAIYNDPGRLNGFLVMTEVLNPDGSPHTAHTTNPVPVMVITERNVEVRDGILADVAPTILDLMEIKQPEEMSGTSLI